MLTAIKFATFLAIIAASGLSDGNVDLRIVARRQHSLLILGVNAEKSVAVSTKALYSSLNENNPLWMDVDFEEQRLLFVESLSAKSAHDRLQSLPLDSAVAAKPQLIARTPASRDELITAVAFDWATRKAYLAVESGAARSATRLEACRLDSATTAGRANLGECAVLIANELDSLHALVVDPIDGYMYWLNRVHKRIERAWMNGRQIDRHPFHDPVAEDRIFATTALTLDSIGRRLFYVRTRSGADKSEIVECAVHSRKSCRVIMEGVQAMQLGVFKEKLFWSSATASSGLRYCERSKCPITVGQIHGTTGVEGFRIVHEDIQPQINVTNPCSLNSAGCSDFCLLTPGDPFHSCSCPSGVPLLGDGRRCDPRGVRRLLLVGTASALFRLALDTDEHLPRAIAFGGKNPAISVADMDFDFLEKRIYWIDREARRLRRADLDGSGLEDLEIPEIAAQSATALAVDSAGRNLFFLDSSSSRIELFSLKSPNPLRQTLVADLRRPRALRLAAEWLYFSNAAPEGGSGGGATIERSWLDGSHREIVVRMGEREAAAAIELDSQRERIYWVDAEKFAIVQARLSDGGGVRVIARDLDRPHSLSRLGSTLFVNSLGHRPLSAIDLSESPSFHWTEPNDALLFGRMSLKAVDLDHRAPPSGCGRGNGGCEHFCLQRPDRGSPICLCAVGFELQPNGRQCIRPATFIVGISEKAAEDLWRLSTQLVDQKPQKMSVGGFNGAVEAFCVDSTTNELIIIATHSPASGPSSARLLRSSFDGGSSQLILEDRSLRGVRGVAVDTATGNIYWTDGILKRIEVVTPKSRRSVVWRRVDPRQIAVDSALGVFVFVDCSDSAEDLGEPISPSLSPILGNRSDLAPNFGGKSNLNENSIGFEQQLASNAQGNSGKFCRIRKCPLAGCPDAESSVFVRRIAAPVVAFALDPQTAQLLWSDGSQLYSIGLNGRNANRVMPSQHIGAIAAHSGFLFWSNSSDSTIRRLRSGAAQNEILHKNVNSVGLLSVAHSTTKLIKSKSLIECEAKADTSECICLNDDSMGYKCECADQYEMDEATGKCKPPHRFVLIASRDRFLRFIIDYSSRSNVPLFDHRPFSVLPIENVGHPRAVAVDLSSRRLLYWIDGFDRDGGDVKRAEMDSGKGKATHLNLGRSTNCTQFFDVVVDSVGRQLFVSCGRGGDGGFVHMWRIEKDDRLTYVGMVVDGNQRSTATSLSPSPRRLAVFNRMKTLFYVDEQPALDSPQIIRCSLDGRHCGVVVGSGLSFGQNRLSADLSTQRLFHSSNDGLWVREVFADEKTPSRRLLQTDAATAADFVQMGELAVLDAQSLLFTAANQSRLDDFLFAMSVESSPRARAKSIESLRPVDWNPPVDGFARRRAALLVAGTMAATGKSMAEEEEVCAEADCQQLCVERRDQRSGENRGNEQQFECLCLAGFAKSENSESQCTPNVECRPWEFRCGDGRQCIHLSRRCDSVADCLDESDELPLQCRLQDSETESSRRRILADSSTTATTAEAQWVCDDRRFAIGSHLLCDGHWDCGDGSDERRCRCSPKAATHFDCSATRFASNDGENGNECILRSLLCDGRRQCANGADEAPELCALISRPPGAPRDQHIIWAAVVVALLCVASICLCAAFAARRRHKRPRKLSNLNPAVPQTETRFLIRQSDGAPLLEVVNRTPADATEPTIYESEYGSRIANPFYASLPWPQNARPVVDPARATLDPRRGDSSRRRRKTRFPTQPNIGTFNGNEFVQFDPATAKFIRIHADAVEMQNMSSQQTAAYGVTPIPAPVYLHPTPQWPPGHRGDPTFQLVPILEPNRSSPAAVYYEFGGAAGEAMCGATTSTAASSLLLPAPNTAYDRRFYAPPPSAASMSTYGVVKPAGMRIAWLPATRQHNEEPYSSPESETTEESRNPPKLRKQRRRMKSAEPHGSHRVLVTQQIPSESLKRKGNRMEKSKTPEEIELKNISPSSSESQQSQSNTAPPPYTKSNG